MFFCFALLMASSFPYEFIINKYFFKNYNKALVLFNKNKIRLDHSNEDHALCDVLISQTITAMARSLSATTDCFVCVQAFRVSKVGSPYANATF